MSYAIKKLTAANAALLSDLAPDVFDYAIDPARVAAYLDSPGHLMLLAVDGDLVVGQCAGVVHRHPDKPAELYIDEVGTASTHRRQGIARKLMAAMFAWGRELGCEEAWLGTEIDNDEGNALYRSLAPIERETMMFYVFALSGPK